MRRSSCWCSLWIWSTCSSPLAYPVLAAELHADISTLAWVGTAYMLGLSVVIPGALAGRALW